MLLHKFQSIIEEPDSGTVSNGNVLPEYLSEIRQDRGGVTGRRPRFRETYKLFSYRKKLPAKIPT